MAWANVKSQLPGAGGMTLGIFLGVLVGILGLVIALTKIASRPLEEWFVVWLSFVVMPRVYLYQPPEEDIEEGQTNEKNDRELPGEAEDDSLEED
jgi:hypothetical protein